MSVPGQLTKDKFGYSVPVDAPLYEPFPLYYEDIRILMFPYLTDAAKAAALVPPPLRARDCRSAGDVGARAGRLREIPVQQRRRVQRSRAVGSRDLQRARPARMPSACT